MIAGSKTHEVRVGPLTRVPAPRASVAAPVSTSLVARIIALTVIVIGAGRPASRPASSLEVSGSPSGGQMAETGCGTALVPSTTRAGRGTAQGEGPSLRTRVGRNGSATTRVAKP